MTKAAVAAPSSRSYAQTNVQLFEELRELGFAAGDIGKLAEAYRLSQKLLAGQFRGSGRPFLSHSVGTASILARQGATLEVIVAGLLHASYEFGDFGSARRGMTPAKRTALRRRVGDAVERLVAAYAALALSPDSISGHIERAARATGEDRDVFLIRLANALEDALCDNLLNSGPAKRKSVLACLPKSVELADRLGLADLAGELKACYGAAMMQPPNVFFCEVEDRSYAVIPASCGLRLVPWLARAYKRLYSLGRRAGKRKRRGTSR